MINGNVHTTFDHKVLYNVDDDSSIKCWVHLDDDSEVAALGTKVGNKIGVKRGRDKMEDEDDTDGNHNKRRKTDESIDDKDIDVFFEEQKNWMKSRISRINDQVNSMKEENKKLKQKTETLEKENKKYIKQVTELKQQNADHTERYDALLESLNSTKDINKKLNKNIDALNEEISGLRKYDLKNVWSMNEQQLRKLEDKMDDNIKQIKMQQRRLVEDKLLCIICCVNRKNIVIQGCNHYDICDVCEKKQLVVKMCPRCNLSYTNVVKANL